MKVLFRDLRQLHGRIMRREKSAYRQKPRKEPTLLRTCKPNTPSAYILPMMNESTQAEEEYKRKNCARAKSMGGGLVGEFLVCFHEEKQIITWEIWRWGCLVNLLLNRQGKYNDTSPGSSPCILISCKVTYTQIPSYIPSPHSGRLCGQLEI